MTDASRAIALLDLTNLDDGCGPSDVDRLCERAAEHGVAAVCVWPRFVAHARMRLGEAPVRVATVANFPAGASSADAVSLEVMTGLGDGADEIDVVLPHEAFLAGDEARARAVLTRARAATPQGRTLKVILESGALGDAQTVSRAAALALDCGVDFIKTSTGKIAAGASPEAARAMLEAIKAAGHGGLKVSGGVRTAEDAAGYLALADEIMGEDWATPATFRFGASSLLDALLGGVEAVEGY